MSCSYLYNLCICPPCTNILNITAYLSQLNQQNDVWVRIAYSPLPYYPTSFPSPSTDLCTSTRKATIVEPSAHARSYKLLRFDVSGAGAWGPATAAVAVPEAVLLAPQQTASNGETEGQGMAHMGGRHTPHPAAILPRQGCQEASQGIQKHSGQ